MAAGLGLLGHAPDVFWSMTARELEAAMAAFATRGRESAPLSRHDFGRLMARFPDQAEENE